jgi:hypothetical protein
MKSCLLAIGLLILSTILYAIPVYYLWNWLTPDLFGFKLITFWQALGLRFLFSCLFQTVVNNTKNDD